MEAIKVALRMRPISRLEKKDEQKQIWHISREHRQIQHTQPHTSAPPFSFDYIMDGSVSNKQLYINCCQKLINQTLHGFDATIFVYGQTGSGKTHTMIGPQNN